MVITMIMVMMLLMTIMMGKEVEEKVNEGN